VPTLLGLPYKITCDKSEKILTGPLPCICFQFVYFPSAFHNTRPGHLMAAFQSQLPSLEVARIMDPWITQPGYPYITVSVSGTEVTVTQKRFLVKNKDHTDTTMWPIVITFATRESEFANTRPQQIYYKEDGAQKQFQLTAAPTEYFVVNNQQTGYYRVNYDEENWLKIRAALYADNHGGIHVANRAQIVDDLFNFARAGIVDYSTALDILGYIKTEKSYTPWLAFFNGLTHVTRRIVGDAATEEFAYFVIDILSEIYEELGYEPLESDTHTQILLRNHVLNWACRYGHEDCLEKTRAEYARFVVAPETHL
jgi:aminopeptidase N